MDKRLMKILDASGAMPSEILSILFEEKDPYANTSTMGYANLETKLKVHCDKCPLNKKCLSMFKIQPARKNQCRDLISSYVLRKKLILPVPKRIESKLLKIGFIPRDDVFNYQIIPKAYYSCKENGIEMELFPKASAWKIQIRSQTESQVHFYSEDDFQLNQFNEILDLIEKKCIENMDAKIETLGNNQIPSSISNILKNGNEFLKHFRPIKNKISKVKFK